MKSSAVLVLLSCLTVAVIANAQLSQGAAKRESKIRDYWVDSSTGLMWAGKDNGEDTKWGAAMNYCRGLRLAGYADWRLPTIDELQGVWDKDGYSGIKGQIVLTGQRPWSSTRAIDHWGKVSRFAWFLDFSTGRRDYEQLGYATQKRALCVRTSKNAAD